MKWRRLELPSAASSRTSFSPLLRDLDEDQLTTALDQLVAAGLWCSVAVRVLRPAICSSTRWSGRRIRHDPPRAAAPYPCGRRPSPRRAVPRAGTGARAARAPPHRGRGIAEPAVRRWLEAGRRQRRAQQTGRRSTTSAGAWSCFRAFQPPWRETGWSWSFSSRLARH